MTPCLLPPERLLVPQRVPVKGKGNRGKMRFQDAFCGAYFTFAITQEGHIYGFGLSNYHQLGEPRLCPSRSRSCFGLAADFQVPCCPGLLGGMLLGTLDPEHQAPTGHTGPELEIGSGGGSPCIALGLGPSPCSWWV